MGLLDFASKVVTTYKADTRDHVKELEKLKGAEKERAKEAIEQGKQVEAGLEGQLKTFGKLALGIAAAAGAATIAWDAFNEKMEHGRLTTAAAGADIEALKRASGGLKTEMTLLRDAAAMQTGAFKLSQKQMEDVQRAMLALTRQGKDATKVHDSMLQAVTALKTDGLADLGIFIDKAGLSMETADGRAKIFERTMAKLAETSAKAGDEQASAEEKIVAAGTSLQDSWSKLKRGLGELVVAMEPLLTALAKAVSLVAELANKTTSRMGDETRTGGGLWGMASVTTNAKNTMRDFGWTLAMRKDVDASGLEGAGAAEFGRATGDGNSTVRDSLPFGMSKAEWDALGKEKPARRGAGKPGPLDISAALRVLRGARNTEGRNVGASGYGTGGLGAGAEEGAFDMSALLDQQLKGKLDAKRAGEQTFLANMFGPIEEFNVYAKGFEMLTGAVGASMSAWVDGSMSAGQAFKKFISEALKGLASQMLIESLKHAAYAIGSLAFGDVRGAGQHGAAAAAFAAGGIAAGVAARALGGGGAAATPGGGRGAGAAAPSYAGGGERASGGHGVVVIGNSFAHDSPRERRRHAQELVGIATRGAGEVVYG